MDKHRAKEKGTEKETDIEILKIRRSLTVNRRLTRLHVYKTIITMM